ncbi:MAG: hypothetical protein ACK5Q5_24665 [Planctomycetaceae bacterium]
MKPTLPLRAFPTRLGVAAACLGMAMTTSAFAQCASSGGTTAPTAATGGTAPAATAAPAFAAFASPPAVQLQLHAAPQPNALQQAILLQEAFARQTAFNRQMVFEQQQSLASMQARSAAAARPVTDTDDVFVASVPLPKKSAARTEATAAQKAATLRYWQSVADRKARATE